MGHRSEKLDFKLHQIELEKSSTKKNTANLKDMKRN